jgi:hypothetical protein
VGLLAVLAPGFERGLLAIALDAKATHAVQNAQLTMHGGSLVWEVFPLASQALAI